MACVRVSWTRGTRHVTTWRPITLPIATQRGWRRKKRDTTRALGNLGTHRQYTCIITTQYNNRPSNIMSSLLTDSSAPTLNTPESKSVMRCVKSTLFMKGPEHLQSSDLGDRRLGQILWCSGARKPEQWDPGPRPLHSYTYTALNSTAAANSIRQIQIGCPCCSAPRRGAGLHTVNCCKH